MSDTPLVSVIIPFFNTRTDFMKEAIDSIFQQTYTNWEIILVNDGSTENITRFAQEYAEKYPQKISYYEHSNRKNLGIIASRRLGYSYSRGVYITFLDADDIWLPDKLTSQVTLMEQHPQTGMLYGKTLYWYSWDTSTDHQNSDYSPELNLPINQPLNPPTALVAYINGSSAVPCTCSVIIRRETVESSQCFRTDFPNMCEDQMFYSRIALVAPIQVSNICWDWYRQHSSSICAQSEDLNSISKHYIFYLDWLASHLQNNAITNSDLWSALQRRRWLTRQLLSNNRATSRESFRRIIKWVFRLEKSLLPTFLQHRIWKRPT